MTEIKLNPVAAAGTEGFSQFPDVCVGGPDDRRPRRDERALLSHPRIDAGAADHGARPLRAHPRRHARRVPAPRRRVHQGRQGLSEAAQRRDGHSVLSRQRRDDEGGARLVHLRLLREPPAEPGDQRHRRRRHQLRLRHRDDVPQRQAEGAARPAVRARDRRPARLDELRPGLGRVPRRRCCIWPSTS